MISLIIPCYNEQESLPIFYREVTSVARRMDYYLWMTAPKTGRFLF